MNARVFLCLLSMVFSLGLWSAPVSAQEFQFPRDEGRHEGVRFETWMVFAHLKDETGKSYGVVVTFFAGKVLGLPLKGVVLGITDNQRKEVKRYSDVLVPIFERARHTVGWLDERYGRNSLKREQNGGVYTLSVQIDDAQVELQMTAQKAPLVLGKIPVGEERWVEANSLPRNQVRGTMVRNGREMAVKGKGSLEHMWGDAPEQGALREWFGIQLDDGTDLVAYRTKAASTIQVLGLSTPEGRSETLRAFDLQSETTWRSPTTGIVFPMNWILNIPDPEAVIEVLPTFAGQEVSVLNEKYWEGQCTVRGTIAGRPVIGKAFVYLKGYGQQRTVDNDSLALDE
ncbi:MAG: lipocalin family protein [Candidatus Methylomirabilales bacterium]